MRYLKVFQSLTISYGHFLFKHRNWVFTIVSLTLLFFLQPQKSSVGPISDRMVDLIGIAIVLLGAAVRIAVVGLAYIKRGGIDKRIAADALVTEGIFNHCRNPLYVGNLLILTGFFIVHGNIVSILLACVYFGYSYYAIILAEEGFLRQKFGATYESYCSRVHRWGVRINGLTQTFGSMKFNWKRVIAKEYTTVYTWNLTLLSIVSYEWIIEGNFSSALPFAVLYFIGLQIVLISVKLLKNTGYLESDLRL